LELDDDIIENARKYIRTEHIQFEDILTDLEKSRQKAEEEREKAHAYKKETEKLKSDTARKNKQLTERTDKIIERAQIEAKEILEKARAEADEILKEMRTARMEADKAKMIRDMEESRRKIGEKANAASAKVSKSMFKQSDGSKSPKSVKLGEDVRLVSMNQTGTVISLPDAKGDFQVRGGIMKHKTNKKDVRKTDAP